MLRYAFYAKIASTSVRDIGVLIDECVSGDPSARAEFVSRFHRTITAIIVKIACRDGRYQSDLVKELSQDVYVRLLRDNARVLSGLRMRHEGGLASLVQSVAHSVACDYFREKASAKRGGLLRRVDLDGPQADQIEKKGLAERIVRDILFSEIDRALSELLGASRSEDRSVFWLYFRDGLTAKDIATLPLTGLTEKGVESLLARLTKGVRQKLGASSSRNTADEGKESSFPS